MISLCGRLQKPPALTFIYYSGSGSGLLDFMPLLSVSIVPGRLSSPRHRTTGKKCQWVIKKWNRFSPWPGKCFKNLLMDAAPDLKVPVAGGNAMINDCFRFQASKDTTERTMKTGARAVTLFFTFFALTALQVNLVGCNECGDPKYTSRYEACIKAADQAACEAEGGTWSQVGMLQHWACVCRTGQEECGCTSHDQCLGLCRVEGECGSPPIGGGQCSKDSNTFGCFGRIDNGFCQEICAD